MDNKNSKQAHSFDELVLLCHQQLEDSLLLANNYLGVNYPLPELYFNLKGKVAGLAYPFYWKIRLNQLMLQENQLAFIKEVIPHELAHLLVYRYYDGEQRKNIKPHGKEWAAIMNNCFKIEPKVTHRYEVPLREVNMFVYACSCRSHHLSKVRHNKIINSKSNYVCKFCSNVLTFTQKMITVAK